MLSYKIWQRARRLPEQFKSSHFRIHYGYRNSPDGRGVGRDGVRDRRLVERYSKALGRLYRRMTSPPWNRQPPIVGKSGMTEVYLLDIPYPFTATDGEAPFIILPCGTGEVTTRLESLRAEAEAVHEATHVFNFRERPYLPTQPSTWIWHDDLRSHLWACFDEGLSVLMEIETYPHNFDYFRLMRDWLASPATPFDDPSAWYHCWIFLRYLLRKFKDNEEIVNEIWTRSKQDETPYQTINRLLAERPHLAQFASSNDQRLDLLHSYCADAYFLRDPASACYLPDVSKRYGERAVERSFSLKPGEPIKIEGEVGHLSCRYYRFYPAAEASGLRAEMLAEADTPIRAELAVETSRHRKGDSQILQSDGDGESGKFAAEIDVANDQKTDHAVLIVSNCGVRSATNNPKDEHDDRRKFNLQVFAF